MLLVSLPASAQSHEQRRLQVGAKMFLALLAANQGIASKVNDEGILPIVVAYKEDKHQANFVTQHIANKKRIKRHPFELNQHTVASLTTTVQQPVAGIYLAEPLDIATQQTLIQYAQQNQIVLFSPFEGDIERGVMTGMNIAAKVRPYVNVAAIKDAGLNIKPFFLKVAKTYH